MPRDGGGTYTLPAGNPVIPGTIIETTWANPTMSDIAAALTDSLSRTGSGGMLAPFLNADGNAALPGIAWANQQNMGFYRPGLDEMRVSVAGVDKSRWTSSATDPFEMFISSMWVPVMHEAGDYSPTGNWDFSGAASFILGPTPFVAIQEVGATADEGNWNFRAIGDQLVLATATDAAPTVDVENAFWVARTGAVVDYTQFLDEIRIGLDATTWTKITHNAVGPTIIDSQNSNSIHILPNNVQATMVRLGDAGSVSVPIGTSLGQNAGLQIGSDTTGQKVGFVAYANDGARNWGVFFGVHDNDVWGLSLNPITSGSPLFVIEDSGERLFDAVRGGANRLYYNDAPKLETTLLGVEIENIIQLGLGSFGALYIQEGAAAGVDLAGQGQFWVRNDIPNVPMFTDDAGTDFQLGLGGGGGGAIRGALAYRTTTQSISNAVWTSCLFTQEAYDTDNIHDNAINPNRLTVPAGVTRVRFHAGLQFVANFTGIRLIRMRKNGLLLSVDDDRSAYQPWVTFSPHIQNVFDHGTAYTSGLCRVDTGDWFELQCYQSSGGNLNTIGSRPFLEMEIIE